VEVFVLERHLERIAMDRRRFLKTGVLAATAATVLPKFSFGQSVGGNTIRVGACGLGVRGTDAVLEALHADGDVKIVALADFFQDKMDIACEKYAADFLGDKKDRFDVPKNKRFVGQNALEDMLANGDIDAVLLNTPPVFRASEIKKCLDAGKHVFAEKPLCVDPTQARYIENELMALAKSKGLCMACGTQCRHLPNMIEAIERVRDGHIGDIVSSTCSFTCCGFLEGWTMPKNPDPMTVEYQIRRWLSFIWTSGDHYVEQHIHSIDVALWAMGDPSPKTAYGVGGRDVYLRYPEQGDRYSNFSVEYDFGDDVSMSSISRQENGATRLSTNLATIRGTKGTLNLCLSGDPQKITGEKPWQSKPAHDVNPQVLKQRWLYKAMREGKAGNNLAPLINSNFAAILGREATYSGKRLQWSWIKNSKQNLFPENKIDLTSTRPISPIPSPATYKLS